MEGTICSYRDVIRGCFSCVLAVLDVNNLPSHYLMKYGTKMVVIICTASILVLVLLLIKTHLLGMLRIPCGNTLDEVLLTLIFVNVFTFAELLYMGEALNYKYYTLFFFFVIEFVCFIARIIFCTYKKKHSVNNSGSVIELYQLFTEHIEQDKRPIMFSDEVSEHDLLGREGLINLLYNSILNCSTNHVYVIGIKGEWGSGKTTIMNFTKQKLKKAPQILVVDEFDPWVFGSQESLLAAMYDEILKGIGIEYNSYSNKLMVKKIQKTVTDKYELASVVREVFLDDSNAYLAVKRMKKKLKALLNQMNKSIVFMIDNIDRADADNVLFLFKLIGTVFDLPNIVYVLAYDPKRIEEIFSDTNKINPQYTEKIIQQEINVPRISEEAIKRIGYESIERLLTYYGVRTSEMQHYKTVTDTICRLVSDLRQLKRLFNTAFITTFCYDNFLYKPYLLSVEVIRFFEPELYDKIRSNPLYFVSRDTIYFDDRSAFLGDAKKFNIEGKRFFTELFDEYPEYKDILSGLFCYVRRYAQKQDLKQEHLFYDETPEENAVVSISSAKFFNLYFSFGTNEFLRVHDSVCKFVEIVNAISGEKEVQYETEKTVSNIEKELQLEWFGRLQSQAEGIDVEKRVAVALGICKALINIDATRQFFSMSANDRALIVVASLLKNIDKEFIEGFLDEISVIENIQVLDELISDCNALSAKGDDGYTVLKDLAKEKYIKNCTRILDETINLYDDCYYRRMNIWALYRFCKDDEEKIHTYIEQIISKKSVFRIIADLISESIGTRGYGYSVHPENIISLAGDRHVIDDVLIDVEATNQVEEFVLMIWRRLDEKNKDEWGEVECYSPVPISLEL